MRIFWLSTASASSMLTTWSRERARERVHARLDEVDVENLLVVDGERILDAHNVVVRAPDRLRLGVDEVVEVIQTTSFHSTVNIMGQNNVSVTFSCKVVRFLKNEFDELVENISKCLFNTLGKILLNCFLHIVII